MEMNTLDIQKVMSLLPHRYPMLLVDKVKDIEGAESAIGIKNVTINEEVFNGHFPGHPIFPGVFILEALAQTAGLIVMNQMEAKAQDILIYFMSMDNVKFRKPVMPGDQLELHVKKIQSRAHVWKYQGYAKVDGKIHAEAQLTAMISDRSEAA